jgi:hypothetical protein
MASTRVNFTCYLLPLPYRTLYIHCAIWVNFSTRYLHTVLLSICQFRLNPGTNPYFCLGRTRNYNYASIVKAYDTVKVKKKHRSRVCLLRHGVKHSYLQSGYLQGHTRVTVSITTCKHVPKNDDDATLTSHHVFNAVYLKPTSALLGCVH